MTDIKLRRKKISMPDSGCNLKVVWEDLFNPMLDENGVVIRTDQINPTTGNLIPLYPEFEEIVAIPADAVATSDYVTTLIAPALESAKARAQTRANGLVTKSTIRDVVTTLNGTSRIDYEGEVDLTGI